MKRLLGGRARLVAIGVALVVLATASSCGGGGGGGGGTGRKAAKPVITPRQATSVVMKLQAKRIAILNREDPAGLMAVDAGPELSLDRNAIQEAKAQATSLTAEPYTSVTALVPEQISYPAWFVALVKDAQGNTDLDLVTRASKSVPWTLTGETGMNGGPLDWKRARGGWALSEPLSIDPSQKLAGYWNDATRGVPTAGVAPGSMTSGVASSLASTTSTNQSKGWAVALSFSSGGTLPEGLRLQDGGALGFAWVTELLQVRAQYTSCFLQPGSNGFKWDPEVANGNYQEIDVRYTYLEGMAESADGSLSATSLATGTADVGGTPCPG